MGFHIDRFRFHRDPLRINGSTTPEFPIAPQGVDGQSPRTRRKIVGVAKIAKRTFGAVLVAFGRGLVRLGTALLL